MILARNVLLTLEMKMPSCAPPNSGWSTFPATLFMNLLFWIRNVTAYLDNHTTRALLHTDAQPAHYKIASRAVGEAFGLSGDVLRRSDLHIAALLNRGVRVLLFAGAYDLMCNFVGIERMADTLEWPGQADFIAAEPREWLVDGKTAGKTRSYGDLTFATIDGAGHMVRN
jgi:carboxypeptidase C (cathepsin A)